LLFIIFLDVLEVLICLVSIGNDTVIISVIEKILNDFFYLLLVSLIFILLTVLIFIFIW